jgi:TusA-related sulfurtransferase
MTTTPTLWKSQTQVNSTDGGLQDEAQIAALPDGGYVIVWKDDSHVYNPSGFAVVGQRYDSAGSKVGGEVNISEFYLGDQNAPAITVLPNGNIAVAFMDFFPGGSLLSDTDIYVRVYDSAFNPDPIRTDVIDISSTVQTFVPSLTAFADGSYLVSYTAGVGDAPPLISDTDIVGRIVSPTGVVGNQFDIDNQEDNRDSSKVATLSNGNFVVVYEDEFGGDSADTDIRYGIFNANGTPVADQLVVPGALGPGLETDPDVAALRDGGFVVVWTDPDSSVTDIRASIKSNNFESVATNLLVNTSTAGAQKEASVVALADGGFLVSWNDHSAHLVQAQRFDAVGNKIGAEFTVQDGVAPEAVVLADGRIAFAVNHHSTNDNDFDVTTSIWDPRTPAGNFDGINQSDFLWQGDNGQASVWLLHDTSVAFNGAVGPNLGPSWHLIDDGDFNADGRSDFLWQNDNGQAAIWSLNNGTTLAFGSAVGPNPGPSWHVIGTSDFNGDNKSDILWQGDDGTPSIWLMNGGNLLSNSAAGSGNPGPSWQIKGSGDFNGDGKSDILWQGDDGTPAIWLMNGAQSTWVGAVGPFPSGALAGWQIKGSGDFNGDGNSDILWQGSDGTPAIWLMDGTNVLSFGAAGSSNPGPSWQIAGSGDYDGDGNSDILWQGNSGLPAIWLMDGLSATGGAILPNPGSDWHIIA